MAFCLQTGRSSEQIKPVVINVSTNKSRVITTSAFQAILWELNVEAMKITQVGQIELVRYAEPEFSVDSDEVNFTKFETDLI